MFLIDILKKSKRLSLLSGLKTIEISDVVNDSKKVKKGSLFFAITGEIHDGHNFIKDAIDRGASAIVHDGRKIEKKINVTYLKSQNVRKAFSETCGIFWSQTPEMIVCVTGTNGKTSVVEYLRQLWDKATWNSASMGTLGLNSNKYDFPKKHSNLTTPSPDVIFSNLHTAKLKGIKNFAFEASSHGLKQSRIINLGVNIAIFTNLSRDHQDWHHNMDDYFESKAILFEENLLDGGIAIINADDPWGKKLIKRLKKRNIVILTCAEKSKADFKISKIVPKEFGFDLTISHKDKIFQFPVPLHGSFQIKNALMSAIAAYASGLPFQDTFGEMANLIPIRGRMEPIYGHPLGAKIIIDFAHTPEALKVTLSALRAQTSGSLNVLFGCGGNRDKGKRGLMGKVADKFADKIYITDDNPRNENPKKIRTEIMSKCPNAEEISPREIAIKHAISQLRANDSLLIAGKGHETYQLVGTETLPFDDASIARNSVSLLEVKDLEI